jgi:hypothetical protein
MQGTLTQVGAPKKFMRVSLAVYSPRELEMAVTENAGRLAVILDGRRAYLRADDRFWAKASHGGAGSALFANHWFLFPAATADKLSKSLGPMTPSYMARCMVEQTGKVTLAGRTTVDHRSAVVLRSAASGPGQQSERIAVALDGPPYPLQLSARGKPLPGHAKAGPCDSCGSGPAQVGTVTMSDFGRVGKLHVPKHAPTVLEFARHAAAVHLA